MGILHTVFTAALGCIVLTPILLLRASPANPSHVAAPAEQPPDQCAVAIRQALDVATANGVPSQLTRPVAPVAYGVCRQVL
ncbi:MAG: hypothetical protein AB7G06_02200 [Bdellovibrionales bacterium]